jgi:hypothetical protein
VSRRPARFTEADLYRAAKAAKRAGMAAEAMPDGRIRLVPVDGAPILEPATVEPEAPRALC